MKALDEFQDLAVWQKSHNLVLEIYKLTKTFPGEEKFGLIPQMRRATVSIPANIAEGFKRQSKKDKIHFYNIAQGSLQEVRYYIILAKDLKYSSNSDMLWQLSDEIGKMLNGLIKSISGR